MSATQRIGWGVLATGHIAGVFARDLALLPEEGSLVAVGLAPAGPSRGLRGRARIRPGLRLLRRIGGRPGGRGGLRRVHPQRSFLLRQAVPRGREVRAGGEAAHRHACARPQELIALAGERGLF